MSTTICRECKNIFKNTSETPSDICSTCEQRMASEIKVLEVVKLLSLSCGITALCLFIPFLILPAAIGPNSSGTYVMRGKTTATFSFTGLVTLNILNLIASATFFWLNFHLKGKVAKKRRELYDN